MSFYRRVVRPILFRRDPEWLHDRAIGIGCKMSALPMLVAALDRVYRHRDERLARVVAGIPFENPIGLAAGYDKNGRAIPALGALGFGHVEIGSISLDPSPGNPRPRLWRLPEDEALCVHYGLPNEGADAVAHRLARQARARPLGVNVVKTNRGSTVANEDEDAIRHEYVACVERLQDFADYLCLNLSCPNTDSAREHFADASRIRRLLEALASIPPCRPVFLKLAPVDEPARIDAVLEAVDGFDFVAGFNLNLPSGFPPNLQTAGGLTSRMRGAVSGKPVADRIDACISAWYRRMDRRRHHIIGAGGVFTAEDAYNKIRLGASLVQLLTGLVHEGPGVVSRILEGLSQILDRHGLSSIGEAVGTAHGEAHASLAWRAR